MANAVYTIEADPSRKLLRLTLAGFWSASEAVAFAREQQAAVKKLGPPYGTHLTLADVRNFAVQTQEVTAVIRDLVLHATATSKRIALVGGEGLARIQFTRITQRQDVRRFATMEDADFWLFTE
ncbi:MAG: hypothetical protein EON55_15975 [Alphaproteobacteria bacterium]|nr:MAG: hypothetical protein EON55_15975 [Alphaproteobacteria bacterium]